MVVSSIGSCAFAAIHGSRAISLWRQTNANGPGARRQREGAENPSRDAARISDADQVIFYTWIVCQILYGVSYTHVVCVFRYGSAASAYSNDLRSVRVLGILVENSARFSSVLGGPEDILSSLHLSCGGTISYQILNLYRST